LPNSEQTPDHSPAAPENRKIGSRTKRKPRKATAKSLENAALYYLQRFSSSSENLRRVLLRRVRRSAQHHGTDPEEGAAFIDDIIRRYQRSGLLDDAGYAEIRAGSLSRRGSSARSIRAKLKEKGVAESIIVESLAKLSEEDQDPELTAAVAFARRRRRGPYRDKTQRSEYREKDLAALARAGFNYDTAQKVIDAESIEILEQEITTNQTR